MKQYITLIPNFPGQHHFAPLHSASSLPGLATVVLIDMMYFMNWCADVNECEMLNRVCGNALCENVDGSFLCVCPDDTQEFDTTSGLCITIRAPGN